MSGILAVGKGQGEFIEKRDLQQDWLQYTGSSYEKVDTEPTHAIYFNVNSANYRGDFLILQAEEEFSLFVNGALVSDRKNSICLPIDSIRSITNGDLFFCVYSDTKINPKNFKSSISSQSSIHSSGEDLLAQSPKMSFRDFVIAAALTLLIFLIVIIRLNTRLSADYFSVVKMFSLRESDEDQFYYRVTSIHILFYVFTSMLLALFFVVVSQFLNSEGVHTPTLGSFLFYGLQWIKASTAVLLILTAKVMLTNIIASLFGVPELAGFHFFNFIRLVLIVGGLLTLLIGVYFIVHGQNVAFYNFLYSMLGWILVTWVILFFLKLTNRMHYGPFHLFSYICATEIIPVVLLIKVLYA
jgi:hypothetical protein